jgi:Fe-S-cluster-containing hydrogenase component 2
MDFNVTDKKVFKCDLCDGDPQCVRFCDVNALEFVEADRQSISKKRDAAEKLSIAQKEGVALQATA